MDDALERFTFDVEERHWWYRGRRAVIDAVLDGLAPADERPRILDAGCGSGRNMVELARRGRVSGLELAPASLEEARRRDVGPVLPGSLDEPLPFGDSSFDVAVALDVLEHVQDDRAALRELARVLVAGGRLVVTVPQYGWLWGEHDVLSHHRRRYTRPVLLGRAAAAGLAAERVTSFNTVLLAPIALARLVQRARRREQPSSDLGRTPHGVVNAALERVLRAEAALLARGRDLRVGVSLLAVLRRG